MSIKIMDQCKQGCRPPSPYWKEAPSCFANYSSQRWACSSCHWPRLKPRFVSALASECQSSHRDRITPRTMVRITARTIGPTMARTTIRMPPCMQPRLQCTLGLRLFMRNLANRRSPPRHRANLTCSQCRNLPLRSRRINCRLQRPCLTGNSLFDSQRLGRFFGQGCYGPPDRNAQPFALGPLSHQVLIPVR
jgi:hypothetical protein